MSTPAAEPLTLAQYVKASSADTSYVSECEREAEAVVAGILLDPHTGAEQDCPPALRHRAVLEVGAELFARRGLTAGIATFGTGADGDLTPIRVSRDPAHLARTILSTAPGPFG